MRNFAKTIGCQLLAVLLTGVLLTDQAIAQETERKQELVKASAGVISRSWEPAPPKNPGFNWHFTRFLERHGFKPKPNYKLPDTVAPVWLDDTIVGFVRDRPARPDRGPEMGTFYDREGRLRAWVPAPPPPGRIRVQDSPPMELLRRYTKGWIDWKDEEVKRRRSLPKRSAYDIEVMAEKHLKELKDSAHLYKALLKITREGEAAAANDNTKTGGEDAKPSALDTCETNDAVVAAVNARLLQEVDNPSRMASLAARHREDESVTKLLNCICRVHSGKTESVSVFYQTAPHGGSPNCEDPGNGPCVGQGWGCSRSKFIPDQAALENCGAARVMTKAICEDRKARKQ